MIISFGWTWPALVSGDKTVTRRTWADAYAARFKPESTHSAWDKNPRCRTPHFKPGEIGTLLIGRQPYKEPTSKMTDQDYVREGFAFLDRWPHLIPKSYALAPGETLWQRFKEWKRKDELVWVVCFSEVHILPSATERLEEMKRNGVLT